MDKYVKYQPQFITAKLTPHFNSAGTIPFTKQEGSMTMIDGHLKVTVDGIYLLSMSVGKQGTGYYNDVAIYANGKRICRPFTNFDQLKISHFTSVSCSATARLSKQSDVYVHTFHPVYGSRSNPSSTFSAVLIKRI